MFQKEIATSPVYVDLASRQSKKDIMAQMQRILSSPEFHATDMQRKFLEFIITETLAGNAHEIKGYTVATCVFGRKVDFDLNNDPIVSIQANKLRCSLERYYLTVGQNDPVRFDIPKGTYVPVFTQQCTIESGGSLVDNPAVQTCVDGSWPTLMVRPFQNLTGDPDFKYLIIGLTVELSTELSRYQDVRVLIYKPEKLGSDIDARFAVEGSVRFDASGIIKIDVHLIDLSKNMLIWGYTHCSEFEPARIIHFQEQVAQIVVAKIVGEFGILTRAIAPESRNKPTVELKTYEAILRHHEYRMTFMPDAFLRAFDALMAATARETQHGLTWALLAHLYSANYTLEFTDLDTAPEKSLGFIRKAINLDPENRLIRLISALIRLINNTPEESIAEVEKAITLNPKSLLNMEICGYFLIMLGECQRGSAMVKEAIRHNPYYDPIVHHALWLDSIRQEDYKQAYRETLDFRIPMLFWEPLMKAATLGLLGRIEEGKQAVQNLLILKPDFQARGRILIRHYIKFDDIVEKIIISLDRCGLNI